MDGVKLKLSCPQWLTIPPQYVDRLLEKSDGDACLLYLYILRNNGKLDINLAASTLRRSPQVIRNLAKSLVKMNMLTEDGTGLDGSSPDPEEILHRSQTDPEFKALVDDTQATLGRLLSVSDLQKLFQIYRELGMPADVIMLLIHYCQAENSERYHNRKPLAFANISKMADSWHEQEIMTSEKAEQWLTEQEARKKRIDEVRLELKIMDRDLSPSERSYFGTWTDMGFPPEAIAIAEDRSISNLGHRNLNYMNSVIMSWKDQKLYTVEDIRKRDKKHRPGKKAGNKQTVHITTAAEMEHMRQLNEKFAQS